jgi:hypothetical protein
MPSPWRATASRRLAALEEALGSELVERHSRGRVRVVSHFVVEMMKRHRDVLQG